MRPKFSFYDSIYKNIDASDRRFISHNYILIITGNAYFQCYCHIFSIEIKGDYIICSIALPIFK